MARDLNIKGTAGIVDNDQYVYRKERDISKTMVDWGQAAKDITQTIETIRDDRASQKADLEEKSRTRMNELAKLEQYDSETLNTKMIGASHEGGNFIQMQNDLMRRGLISPSEFLQSTQQLSDNFTQLKTATKGWDAHYKTAMSRLEKDPTTGLPTANALEQFINEGMAGFGNLANLDLIVNPTTGTLSFLKKGADENDPANHQSLNTINARMTQRSDYYDLSTGVQNEVENLGEVVTSDYMARQGVKTTTDWYNLEGNQELMADLVETQMSTDSQKISIMQTHMNLSSDNMTRDENDPRLNPESDEYDESTVLVVANPDGSGSVKPVFSEAQEAKMKEIIANRFRAQIDKKIELVKGHQVVQKSPANIGQDNLDDERIGYVEEFNTMLTGDPVKAAQMFQRRITTTNKERSANDEPLIDPSRSVITQDYAELVYDDGSTERIDFTGDVMQDIISLSDNLVPSNARVNQRQLEKYVSEEGITIGEYQMEEVDNPNFDAAQPEGPDNPKTIKQRVKREVKSKGGIKPVKLLGPDLVVTADGTKQSYSEFFNSDAGGDLGPSLSKYWLGGDDDPQEIVTAFNNLINSAGFIPKQLRSYIDENNGGISVAFDKDDKKKMIIKIGKEKITLDDVYDDGKTGGTDGIAYKIREAIEKENKAYNDKRKGGGGKNTKRTVKQIMDEDSVSREEALKIFKAQ